MIRINPQNAKELQSKGTGMGACWVHRYTSENMGNFTELEFDAELFYLLAQTAKGKFYSLNGGRTWYNYDE